MFGSKRRSFETGVVARSSSSSARSELWRWRAEPGLRSLVAAILCTLCIPDAASAQREIEIDDFRPAHDAGGFFGVQGTTTPGPGRWNVGMFSSYTFGLLRVNPSFTSQQVVVRHRVSMDALFQIGLGERFALTAEVPFVPHQDGAEFALADGEGDVGGAALGDVRVHARARLWGDVAESGNERPDGPGFGAMLSVSLPTEVGADFVGARLPVIDVVALADFHVLNLGIGANVGVRVRPDRVRIAGRVHGSELLWGVALAVPIPVAPEFVGILEFRGSSGFQGRYNTPTEVDLGVRARAGDFHVSLVGGTAFPHRAAGAPSVRAMISLRYAPPNADSDGDGVPDARDECPLLPEDFDGFADDDGCMDPDNDNDLIPDVDDLCPNDEALEGQDDDEDGCTDARPVTAPARA